MPICCTTLLLLFLLCSSRSCIAIKESETRDGYSELIQGQGHWPAQVTDDMLPVVKELFTFGAPGTGNRAAWNQLKTHATEWCFPGLRMYKEAWKNSMKHIDFAAGCCQSHARQNVVILGPAGSPDSTHWGGDENLTGSSKYRKCDGEGSADGTQSLSQNGRPVPGDGSIDSTAIHMDYSDSLKMQILEHWDESEWDEVDGTRDRDQFIRAFPGAEITSGLMLLHNTIRNNAEVQIIKDWIELKINNIAWPSHSGRFNMKLVGAMEHFSNTMLGQDDDLVVLVQQQGTGAPGGFDDNGCILAFEGTDLGRISELLLALDVAPRDFCGSARHGGFVEELRGLLEDPKWKPSIQDKLSSCSSVTVAGYSLGGSLAELFTFCAHRPHATSVNSTDFQLLTWQSGQQDKVGQRLAEFQLAS